VTSPSAGEGTDFAAVLLIGGRARSFCATIRVIRIVREFDRQRKWIFSVCHGIQSWWRRAVPRTQADLLSQRAAGS